MKRIWRQVTNWYYDGNLLVGAFTLDQVCTPDNQFENDLKVFSTLTNGPGYNQGTPLH